MPQLILKHLLLALLVVFSAVTITFILARMGPDPAVLILPEGSTADQRDALNAQLGLDRPFLTQYVDYLTSALRGDFGKSYFSSQTVSAAIVGALPNTLALALTAFVLSVALAIPLGTLSALRPGGVLDRVVQFLSVLGNSMPTFWVALLLLEFLAVGLGLFPAFGRQGPSSFVLPSITITVALFPLIARLTRSAMLNVLRADYVETAEAMGFSRPRVVIVHVMRNGLVPVLALLGVQFGALLAGAILTESVFSWPGIGLLAVKALEQNDIPVIQGIVAYVAVIFALVTLLTEIMIRLANPRLR